MHSLKKRIKTGELTIGSWITIGHSAIVEIMANAGFDWLVLDMEHSAITLDQAQQLIQVIELCGISPLVRVGENNPNIIKRVMDAGAHGVVVPMVNSKDDAERAVHAVKYPPRGTRGVGLARAQGYGLEFNRYKKWVNEESIVIVQIEHIKATANLDEIFSVPDIDGFIVGPYDLSASIGRPGEFSHPEVEKALAKVLKFSKKNNVTSGFHVIPPEANKVHEAIKKGYRFVGFSLDTLFLGIKCREQVHNIKEMKL